MEGDVVAALRRFVDKAIVCWWHIGGCAIVVPTLSTGNRAFIGAPAVRKARMAALREAFARTARIPQQPYNAPPIHS